MTDFSCYISEQLTDNNYLSLTFCVSTDFSLPTIYKTCRQSEFQKALVFGAELLEREHELINERATESVIGNSLDDLKKKQAAELIRKDDSWRRQLEAVQEELRVARNEFISLQNDFESRLKGQLEVAAGVAAAESGRLRQLISELEDGRSAVAAETRAAVLAELDSIQVAVLREKDSMISYLREKETGLAAKVDSLQEILISRTKSGANAALSGRSGEDDFCEAIAEYGIDVVRTASESHMCDYRGVVSDFDVMFEVKNHKDRILVKEITKFRRDMKEHPEVRCGVFVGLNAMYSRAGIEGIYGNGLFGVEVTAEKQLLVYIGEFFKNDVGWLVSVLKTMIGGVCPLLERDDSDDNGILAELECRIRSAVSCVQSIGERGRVLYNKIINDRKAADDAFVGTLSAVKMMREEIQMLLGVLLGNAVFAVEEKVGAADGAVGGTISEYDMAESVILEAVEETAKKRGMGKGRKKKIIPSV